MNADVERDYYAILGIAPSATSKEIQRAYHRLARRYHPDSREVHTPTTLFHQVQEAYSVLSDPSSRETYDRRRGELGDDEPSALVWNILLSRDLLYAGHEEQVLYVLSEIEPAQTWQGELLPLDLSIVIDRSTSMEGARLESTKEAASQVVDELQEDDTLAIVSFSDRAEVALSGRVGSQRRQFKAAISALRAGGGTELLQGLRVGLHELAAHQREHAVSHLILLTDGRTYGDERPCLAAADAAGKKGIAITALGIGEDWNDDLLDELAARSGGTSAYIGSPRQVQGLLRDKVRHLGSVHATALELTVRAANGVRVENAFLISPSLGRLDLSRGVIPLGSLASDRPLRVLLEAAVRGQGAGEHRLLQLELNGEVSSPDDGRETLRKDVRCAFAEETPDRWYETTPPAVLSALRRATLYRMQEQAWYALEDGDVQAATQRLQAVATQLLDLGEERLGRAALLEAERVAKTRRASQRGRLEIKYGTRSLKLGGDAYD
ncbi:MAG: VWA domain-containing protein [Chloroflexota bacterium]